MDSAKSTGDDAPVRVVYAGGVGLPLAIVYRSRTLVPADLPGDAASVHDEHGRPLVLSYGFVTNAERISYVHGADLELAWTDALRTYREFLRQETDFAARQSARFAIRSTGTLPARVPAAPDRRRLIGKPLLPAALGVAAVALVGLLVGLLFVALRPGEATFDWVIANQDGTGAFLTSQPRQSCAAPDCRRLGNVKGQRLKALCWVRGDPMTDSPVARTLHNADQGDSSDRWYRIELDNAIAYLPEVWTDRAGRGLPECDPSRNQAGLGPIWGQAAT